VSETSCILFSLSRLPKTISVVMDQGNLPVLWWQGTVLFSCSSDSPHWTIAHETF
jgi:hypothetical protein